MKALTLRLIFFGVMPLLMITACSSPSPTPTTPTPLPTGMVGGMVEVGGRELFYKCSGEGSPTVILEAGGDADSADWDLVMAYFGETARVCAYDRANLGSSDSAPKPRSAQDMVRDLHALLANAHIAGPYILVGHSGGGLVVRLFADQYRDEVAGMLLVDAAHPEMGIRLLAGLPPESADEPESIKAYRQLLTRMSSSDGSSLDTLEGWDMLSTNAQVKATKALGGLPLVVISRNPGNELRMAGMPPLDTETSKRLMQIWQDMQSELVGLSSNSTQVFAQGGHEIPGYEPRLIVEALSKLVNEARDLTSEAAAAESAAPAKNAGSPALSEDHTPVILRIAERRERKDGRLIIYEDIYFTDKAGDASVIEAALISGDLGEGQHLKGGLVEASAEEQRGEAMETATWVCYTQGTYVLEMKFIDRAGYSSEPLVLTFPCPAPWNFSLFLIIGPIAGLGLLAVLGWLLLRNRRARRAVA